jgi:hypothetical protein
MAGFYGGFMGNQGAMDQLAAGNPLTDPRFKIPGGQPWNRTPILPGKETKEFEGRPINLPQNFPLQTMGGMSPIGNAGFFMGPQLAQAVPSSQPSNTQLTPERLSEFENIFNQLQNESQINRGEKYYFTKPDDYRLPNPLY